MMSGSKLSTLSVSFIFLILSSISYCSSHKTAIVPCPEIEKQALLSFKQSLRDPRNALSSWNTSNCCNWKGVSCANSTGRVDGLHLYRSGLQGQINPSLINLTSLATLVLTSNRLTGKIPRGIANLCRMKELELGDNKLEGEISDSFGNMSDCFLGALTYLDLSFNRLSGHLTRQFGEFRRLQQLHLSANNISGEFPANLGNLSYLEHLWLYNNKLTGNLPMSMGRLSNLNTFRVGNNMLEGVVSEGHFVNCSELKVFSASGNRLTLKVSPDWIPPFSLSTLRLGSWNLGAGLPVPPWLHTQEDTLVGLDLSSTGISGDVPAWFWRLKVLNISHNHLYGKIPDLRPESGAQMMFLNSNLFRGLLPRVGHTLEEINFSNNSFSRGISHFICDMMTNQTRMSKILHLGGNDLSGKIPDCWVGWPSLRVLNLGNNNFSGAIPNLLGFLTNLVSLNLYENALSGEIPVSISNCSKLVKIDLSNNYLVGSIPILIGASLAELRFLILRSNKLSGVIPSSICRLNRLQILDISDNVISGIIPACVDNFTAMTTERNLTSYFSIMEDEITYYDAINSSVFYYFRTFSESLSVATKGNIYEYGTILSLVTNIDLSNNNLSGEIPEGLTSLVELGSLNLSGNHLTGSIPKNIGDMKGLESLDFSMNSLSSEIPDSFTAMSSLSYLNLSYNRLTGKVPVSTQLMSMNASSFVGNSLCSPPLPNNCSYDGDERAPLSEEDNEGEIDWFYVFLSLGYAVGFSAVCTALLWKESWRNAYFGLLECMWHKLYVYFHTK